MTTTVREPATEQQIVLETHDLAVHYGGIKAVDGVDMSIPAGRIVGMLGPNGSGKSTLIAALTRHCHLTRGDVLLDGVSYRSSRPHQVARKRIARTFQTVRLLDELTVLDNIRLAADVRRSTAAPDSRGSRIDRAQQLTGVGWLGRRLPSELSYGWRRRVEIARALAGDPRLLLLDEPTAGMTRPEKDDISALLAELRAQGVTQLLVEHDVQMMIETCDYLYAMNYGVLIAQGRPHDVVRNEAVQEAYLGRRAAAARPTGPVNPSAG